MQTIHYRAMFVMKVPFTMTLSLENNKNKTISHRILNDQKIESDGPIKIFVIAKLKTGFNGNFLFASVKETSRLLNKGTNTIRNKKLSYRRGTARCVVSIEILPIATQQCRNYSTYTTSPEQIDGMKLEI